MNEWWKQLDPQEVFERKVQQYFSEPEQRNAFLEQLEHYNTGSSTGRYRVYLSILKLHQENYDVQKLIKSANKDFRDVLANAEYPRQLDSSWHKKSKAEKKNIIEEDLSNYLEWLNS